MAPIDGSIFKQKGMATASTPPDTISWRPMVVNWFGSMVLIGLCAPMMVWFTVYCIRTRMSRRPAKGKLSAAQSAQPPAEGRDGVQTYGVVPLAPGPSGRDHDNEKIPMSTHLRRYLGWWSSDDTSREGKYPRDPRARKNRNHPYTKRDHFAHYFGWWTCSEETGKHAASSRAREDDSMEHPGIEIARPSTGSRNEVESLDMQPLGSVPRVWLPRHHKAAPHDLFKRGQVSSSQQATSTVEPTSTGRKPQRIDASATGVDVKQFDGFGEDELPTRGEAKWLTADDPSSDETSGHQTVRRRTVGVAEACDWANLSSELRRSVHSQLLLPDVEDGERSSTRGPKVDKATSDVPQTTDDNASPTRAVNHEYHSPKLRKVCSSPSLHLAFKQLGTSVESRPFSSIESPHVSHSNPIPVTHHCQCQLDRPIGDKTSASFRSSTSTGITFLASSSMVNGAESASKSNRAFSFDRTRRSTLDLVRAPAVADRQTLDDYEAECSIDAELLTRDGSGTTLSSFQSDIFRKTVMPKANGNGSSINLTIPERTIQSPKNAECMPMYKRNQGLNVGSSSENSTFPGLTQTSTDDLVNGLELQDRTADRFAPSILPKRRHSFPDIENGKGVESKVARKVTFCSWHVKEKKEDQEISKRCRRSPSHGSKCSVEKITGNAGLEVAKTRGSRLGKSKTKRKAEARKLTPFVDSSHASSPIKSPRKALPKDWQILSRLSEAASFRSENEPALTSWCEANGVCSQSPSRVRQKASCCSEHTFLHVENEPVNFSGSPDGSIITDPGASPASFPGRCAASAPKPHLARPLRIPPTQIAKIFPLFMSHDTLRDTGALRSAPVQLSDKTSSAPSVLIETQLQSKGGPVKRAYTSQCCAEKAKRRESMRRAGRLVDDQTDL